MRFIGKAVVVVAATALGLGGATAAHASETGPIVDTKCATTFFGANGDYFDIQDDCKDGHPVAVFWQVGLPCGWGQPPCPPKILINSKGSGTMVRRKIHWKEEVPILYKVCTVTKGGSPIKCSEVGRAVT